jgi:hypothetical protein
MVIIRCAGFYCCSYIAQLICCVFHPVICNIEPGNTFRRYLLSLNSYQQLWHIKSDAFLLLVHASKSCMISIFFFKEFFFSLRFEEMPTDRFVESR